MTNSQPHRNPPSQKQLVYLRDLAESRGQTFVVPRSSAEASAEIERLKGCRAQPRVERWLEATDRGRKAADHGAYAPAFRDDEIEGYGSNCRWLHQTRG
jgi:hypothetical protein